jgi:hypothetical protein
MYAGESRREIEQASYKQPRNHDRIKDFENYKAPHNPREIFCRENKGKSDHEDDS